MSGKADPTPPLLKVDGLSITYHSRAGIVPAVRHVSFEVGEGESLGLVGESGCGKSTLAFAVMNHLGRSGRVSGGRVMFRGRELALLPAEELRLLRGREMAMVYQDPMSCLNPVLTVGTQLMEVPCFHEGMGRKEARQRALEILREVHLPDPEGVLERYPHQLSGGQQQRALIAMALMSRPSLLVLDEPTTGLDVTIEAAILDLVAELRSKRGMGLLFISHNLGTVMRVCERVGVMYCGELVEQGPIEAVFSDPRHPYTRGLLDCLPRLDAGRGSARLNPIPGQMAAQAEPVQGCIFARRCQFRAEPLCTSTPVPVTGAGGPEEHLVRCLRSRELPRWKSTMEPAPSAPPALPEAPGKEPLLRVEMLHKSYQRKGGWGGGRRGGKDGRINALNGVSMTAEKGRTLAIVGESGCGKSTLAKVVAGLEEAGRGSVKLDREELANAPVRRRSIGLKRSLQMVFQHPGGTLNPSHTVGFAIGRSLRRLRGLSGGQPENGVKQLLRTVNLPEQFARRLPSQLSGGQKQRVAIARALAGNPTLVVADEPVSALDVSVQASIINLLLEIQKESGTTMLFISHDLAVVRYLADHVAVMYLGQVMEFGRVEDIFDPPYHPYTEALLSSIPLVEMNTRQRRIILEGELPSATEPPKGCPFQSRCHRKIGPICELEPPPQQEITHEHRIACHIPLDELKAMEPVLTPQRV